MITGSDPADGSTVPTAPTQVSVTFDETPQPEGAALTVVGPDGAHHEQGAVTVRDKVVSVPVGALPPAGAYEIGYRVVSSDGHPVSGSVAFTLTTPSPPPARRDDRPPRPRPPRPTLGSRRRLDAPPSPAASSGPDTGSGGVPAWVFVVIAVVVVGGAVALVLRRRA